MIGGRYCMVVVSGIVAVVLRFLFLRRIPPRLPMTLRRISLAWVWTFWFAFAWQSVVRGLL